MTEQKTTGPDTNRRPARRASATPSPACSSSSRWALPPASSRPRCRSGPHGTPLARVAKSIEFPVYAIALGLLGNFVLSKLALRDALSQGFRTEFFIKTGLVLLGASINLKVLVTAAGPAIIQALLLITHRVRLHLVAGRPARPGRQAARTAGVGRVDLRRQRGDRGRGCRAGQEANNWPTPRRWSSRSRCRRSSCCRGSPTCSTCPMRSPARGSAATSTPPPPSPRPVRSPVRTPCRSRPSSRPPRTR